jgi:UDP-glucose 4-epimerase
VDAFTDYYPRPTKERNLEKSRSHGKFRLVEGRLQDLDLRPLLDGVDRVFHLAAQAGVRASWGREFAHYTDHNVLATQRLLEAARAAGGPRVVYASSSSVVRRRSHAAAARRRALRARLPVRSQQAGRRAPGRPVPSQLRAAVVSLRYFTVYGPRQRPDMAFHRFLKAARDAEPIHLYGDGGQTRDFTFVSDIVAATRAAADSGRPGSVYNVGGGERVVLSDVLRQIEGVTGRRLTIVRDEVQKGDMRDTFADTTAARRDLGFRSTVALAQGLEREWEWIRGQA